MRELVLYATFAIIAIPVLDWLESKRSRNRRVAASRRKA